MPPKYRSIAEEFYSLDSRLSSIKRIVEGVIREELGDYLLKVDFRDERVFVYSRGSTAVESTNALRRLQGFGFAKVTFV